LEGEPGAQNALFRVQGFQEKLKEAPGMELVASQTGHWTTAGAMQAMENILQANPDLNAVFASSDMMAVGAVEALRAAGKLEDVTLVSFDGIPDGIALIQQGVSDGDVAQFPTKMGEWGIIALAQLISGDKTAEDFPEYIDSGAALISPDTADQFLFETFGIGMPKWKGADKSPEEMTIVVVPKSVGHPYWADVDKGVVKGGEDVGCNAIFNGPPQADINAQINLIEDFISTGVDGLAISPNDPTAIAPVIGKALDAGIPTITFDADAPESDRLMYIGTDNVVGGDQLGQELVRLMEGEGKVAFLTGGLAALNLNQRLEGAARAIADYPDIELVGTEAHNDNLEVAYTLVENLLTAYPDLKALYCASGATAAAKALKAQGRAAGEIIVVGFDVFDPTPEFIREDYIQAVVSQRPFLMGELSVKWLVDLNLGTKAPPESKVLDTGTILVTAENLEEYLSAPH
jgi:ribose transport system substrate-binding protein